MGKLDLSISKSTNMFKIVNSKEVSTLVVEQGVKLQIGHWKGKQDFKVIHLDDY